MVGIEGSEAISSKFMVNALMQVVFMSHFLSVLSVFISSFSSVLFSDISITFSSESAETEVLEDSVSEFVEFFLVNFTWGLGVDLFAGGLNPFPLFLSDGVVHGTSEFLKSFLDLFVGEGSVVVGIEGSETISSKFVVNAFVLSLLLIVSSDIIISFSSKMAEIEVMEDSVSELPEFMFVNFTWGLGVDLFTGGFNPFPFFLRDGVVHVFSEFLKSYLDLFVGEGSVVVGIEVCETISSHFVADASFMFISGL